MSSQPRSSVSRTILHLDLDAFYCSVEEQRDPALRGLAFAVGGRPEVRGVVASCSYAARQRGIHSAMSMAHALRLCPSLVIVPVRHSKYREVSETVMGLLRRWTPFVEQLSIDEAFLDVTQLLEDQSWTSRALALTIQTQIREELNLSCSIGVASNKMVAKIATDYGKAAVRTGQSPHALCVVPAGKEATFLAPLPVTALWGVGPKTAEQLAALGITSIGELAQWPQRDLLNRFGRHGFDLSRHAQGIDKREVVTERESKSISSETTFVSDVQEWEPLHTTLQDHAQSVAAQLHAQKLQGTTIKLKLRWSDFTITTRQTTLLSPTAQVQVIEATATQLLKQLWNEEPVRLLGVGVSGLSPVRQLSLWDNEVGNEVADNEVRKAPEDQEVLEPNTSMASSALQAKPPQSIQPDGKKQKHLQQTLTLLQEKFGPSIVQVAGQLQQPPNQNS